MDELDEVGESLQYKQVVGCKSQMESWTYEFKRPSFTEVDASTYFSIAIMCIGAKYLATPSLQPSHSLWQKFCSR